MDSQDLDLGAADRWTAYLNGTDPAYPVDALRRDFSVLREKVEEMHRDDMTPDTRMSDDLNPINPVTVDALSQLMLGGLPPGRQGSPLHCRLRYFDPERRRAGVPADVGALVEGMTGDDTTLSLVNLSQVDARTVVVQGGAYAEHQLLSATIGGQEINIGHPWFTVRLAAGSGATVTLRMERYANRPTLVHPWT
jgi:hypothetical protein